MPIFNLLHKLTHLVTVGLHTVCGTYYSVLQTVPGTGKVRYCTVPYRYKAKVIKGNLNTAHLRGTQIVRLSQYTGHTTHISKILTAHF
jgi:hypothetical protein